MRVTLTKHSALKATLPKVSRLVLGLGAVLFGCSDSPTSPEPSATPPSFEMSGEGVTAESAAVVLNRTQPLLTRMSVTRTIGPAGGTIAIPAAGIKVTFPACGVAAEVPIIVSAPAGRVVVYTFAAFGLNFRQSMMV